MEVSTCPRSIPRHLFCFVTDTAIQTAVLTVPLLLCDSCIPATTDPSSVQENSAKSLLVLLYCCIYTLAVNCAWKKPGRIKVCCHQWLCLHQLHWVRLSERKPKIFDGTLKLGVLLPNPWGSRAQSSNKISTEMEHGTTIQSKPFTTKSETKQSLADFWRLKSK